MSKNSDFGAVLTGILTTLDERPTTNIHEASDNCQLESLDGDLWHSETHFREENSVVFTAFELGGFRALAPRKSSQPPLFLLFLYYILTIEGPWTNSFAGIVFLIYGLGIKPASTCCEIHSMV